MAKLERMIRKSARGERLTTTEAEQLTTPKIKAVVQNTEMTTPSFKTAVENTEITIPKFKVAVEDAEMTVPKFKVAVENTVHEPNPITFEKRGEALMTRDAFLDSFTDSSIYCDLDVRPKTAKALRKLAERIPDNIFNDLPRIVVFAPNPDDNGSCLPLMPSDSMSGDALIYVAPSLERQSQTEVDFTVAHEFAHASLRHHEPKNLVSLSVEEAKKRYLNWDSEVAADQLVAEWGYKIPKRRKSKRQ